MRVSIVVNRTKYCCRKVMMTSTPVTTNKATVRLSSQSHVEPANVKTMTSATIAAVKRKKPSQSRALTLLKVEVSEGPEATLTDGR